MPALSLVLRLTAIAGGIVAIALFLVIGNSKQRLEDQLVRSRLALAETEAERARWEADATRLEARAAALDSDLAAERTRATQAASQLAQARRELTQQGQELQTARRLADERERDANQLRRSLLEAHASAATAEAATRELAARESELERLRGERERLRADLDRAVRERDAAAAASAGTALAQPGATTDPARPMAAAAPTRSVPGEILAVNAGTGILGIDYGSLRGATPGAEVILRLEDGTHARIVLATVERDYSVARIVAGNTRAQGLRPGEPALILLP